MTADEVLQQMQALQSDNQSYCVIDPDTREISIPSEYQLLGVESDEKAERIWFRCPKIVGDNIDLTELQLRVNYQNANSQKDQYIVTDMQAEGDNIIFSWLLSRKVTAYQGNVSFIVCAVRVSGETIQNEWNTTLAMSQVLQGLEVENPEITEEESDVIAQLLQVVTDTSEQAVSDVNAAKVEAISAVTEQQITSVGAVQSAQLSAVSAIENAGESIKESLPLDYSELSNKVDELDRTKAPAITEIASGESIEITDSGNAPLQSVRLYGRSKQVTTTGKNMAEVANRVFSVGVGVTITVYENGSYRLDGVATASSVFRLNQPNGDPAEYPTIFTLIAGKKYRIIGTQLYGKTASNQGGFVDGMNGMSGDGVIYKPSEDTDIIGIRCYLQSGTTYDSSVLYTPGVWEDPDENDTAWEPYTGGKPSPSPEYPQEIKSSSTYNDGTGQYDVKIVSNDKSESLTKTSQSIVSFLTPFLGIPVSSGGNYTDADGQQWICDEIQADLVSGVGVYIQRCAVNNFDGSSDEGWSILGEDINTRAVIKSTDSIGRIGTCNRYIYGSSTRGEYFDIAGGYMRFNCHQIATTEEEWRNWLKTNPITVYYALILPIQTLLTTEQISAFKALQTYATTTNITGGRDVECGKEVVYLADTKTYIDAKIKEILQSVSAT